MSCSNLNKHASGRGGQLRAQAQKVGWRESLTQWLMAGTLAIFSVWLPAVNAVDFQGCVFLDQNSNGTYDAGELVQANAVVYLMDNQLVQTGQGGFFTAVTGGDGCYYFFGNNAGDFTLWIDIPPDMRQVTPVAGEVGQPAFYDLTVPKTSQTIKVNFGLIGTTPTEIWSMRDDGVMVSNSEYDMLVKPNKDATEKTEMQVNQVGDTYQGDNQASQVYVSPNDGTRSRRSDTNEFSILVGKNVSETGEEIALDARTNPDGSVSFMDPEFPTVSVTANQDGTYTAADSESPTVTVAIDSAGNITATDSDDPTMSLSFDKTTGVKTVTDSEYPTALAVINLDGSYTVTDEEFPNLIATVYGNNEYKVQDLVNNMVVHIDSQGNYTMIDNQNGVCVVLPKNTRGFFSKLWKGIKNVFSSVTRFIGKVAGFVAKVARFVVKVTQVISAVAKVVASIARVAAVLFPPLCQLFCAVAAFAEGVAKVSDAVGEFAKRVAYFADRIKEGAELIGWWVSPARQKSACDFETPQRCFGASGPGCQIIPDPVHPVTLDTSSCMAKGFVTVGSILHDICCFKQEQKGEGGHMCRGNLLATACKAEWDKAANDTTNDFPYGHGWYVNFGPYFLGSQGDDVSPATQSLRRSQLGTVQELAATMRLSAPPSTKLDITDADFCQSGMFSMVAADYGVCQ